MSKYEDLKQNWYYKNKKELNDTLFCSFIVATILAKEDVEIQGALQYVKFIKNENKEIGLKYCKEWFDLLRGLGFILWDFDHNYDFKILNEITEINSKEDLFYMIDHNLTIKYFLRISKIKKLKNNINENIK